MKGLDHLANVLHARKNTADFYTHKFVWPDFIQLVQLKWDKRRAISQGRRAVSAQLRAAIAVPED